MITVVTQRERSNISMENRKTINKVALAIFKDKQILFVRSHKNEEVFYTLGGKVNEGESDEECLIREVKEEINCDIEPVSIKFLQEFQEVAHGKENTWLVIRMYTGTLIGDPTPSSEIAEIGWFDSNSDQKHISEMGQRRIIPWLKENGYIN